MESTGDKLRQRYRELAILHTIATELNRSVDLEQIVRVALAQTTALLNMQTGWLWLLDEETGAPYLAAAQNLPPALVNDPRVMEAEQCYCLDTYRAGKLTGTANINVITCSRLAGLVDGTGGLRYHTSVPLYAQEKKLGVLNVVSADWQELAADDLRLLHTVGELLSMAIERARLFAQSVRVGAVEERYRLARELHDTLGQGLTAILLKLETVDALLESGKEPEEIRRLVQQTLRLARSTIDDARRSVMDLRAVSLEGRTLEAALQALATEISDKAELEVTFASVGGNRPLPARVEAGLYRMAQETLNNVIQHAGARRADVQLIATPERVRLLIADDGQGFDPAQQPEPHYGLVGINERARLLGGHVHLDSRRGHGTRLEISLPLEPEP